MARSDGAVGTPGVIRKVPSNPDRSAIPQASPKRHRKKPHSVPLRFLPLTPRRSLLPPPRVPPLLIRVQHPVFYPPRPKCSRHASSLRLFSSAAPRRSEVTGCVIV